MTTILVIGKFEDTGLEEQIKSGLTRSYRVTYVKGNRLFRGGSGYPLLVLDTEYIDIEGVPECIIVLKNFAELPALTPCEKTVVIAGTEDKSGLLLLKDSGFSVISCGAGKGDTLSYSSLTSDGIVVSLNREITAFSGRKIQPLELPVSFLTPGVSGGISDYYNELAFTALRLVLDDFDSEIGKLF
ncbi:hypothetical protein FACS189499_04350 [Clostridia bacterium]|nr:hypothetical protein FACS189499_04350 [Clostridia bacterium]